jgi:hydroxymethylpyrimidine pyrophosphatase-like HAD family hydrolase
LDALAPFADDVTTTVSGGPFVEVMAAGVTKALALAELCAERGIAASEVVAVGDHTNDLPMLRWAGRGVAMGNAHPSVLAEIKEHTASNVDDGLALVIESLLA